MKKGKYGKGGKMMAKMGGAMATMIKTKSTYKNKQGIERPVAE